MKHYKLTDETITLYDVPLRRDGVVLHRIECIEPIPGKDIKVGDKGGFIEKESNLCGGAWVYDDAKVYDNAQVCGLAKVYDNAQVCGDAFISEKAEVFGNSVVCGHAWICRNAKVFDDAVVCGDNVRVRDNALISGNAKIRYQNDYYVHSFGIGWDDSRYVTWTRSNDMWKTDNFYGTDKEFIAMGYQESEQIGRYCKNIVKIQSMLD